ncbi:hypothetical protein [Bacillus suaedae]|uniref:Uncharacterized protein n=1 Tax=Halalkalibacter suaedae TaxID=2822140 RepID=A0A940WWL7_9BACI|nr:hypothetical protein [Bacillus suaedae]MBP3951708.1 hypothetical protein [Bacillus suaedae]
MENETEKQILKELKSMNKSLQEMNKKIDNIDSDGKPSSLLWDISKSLLIGVFILGPAIVVVMSLFQLIGSWLFN